MNGAYEEDEALAKTSVGFNVTHMTSGTSFQTLSIKPSLAKRE